MKTFKYFPNTEKDIKKMLEVVGVKSIDDLFKVVPKSIKKTSNLNLEAPLSEHELRENFNNIASKNKTLEIYRGAGSYDHVTPSIIPYLIRRSEFLTSYTPYQPEISQGTLQYIFEFQTMITRLTGLDVANASMYDGATSTAEAVLLALGHVRRDKVLVSQTVDPKIVSVIKTYARYQDIEVEMIPHEKGQTSLKSIIENDNFGAVVVQNPNYYGLVEDYSGFSDVIHEKGAIFVMNNDPSTLAVIKSPRELGVDIATGDGQPLGIPLSFGGPYVGYMAVDKKLMRKMPGRIVGMTKDVDGKRGFVLTLQAREQHIRRYKATSNICSNQSLMALWVTIYLSLMGSDGLEKVNEISYTNAHYLKEKLLKTGHFEEVFNDNFVKEFVLKAKFDVKKIERKMLNKGYLFGLPLDDNLVMFAVTEKHNKAKIDKFVEVLEDALR
ncbi:MAG TPA: aminomethyl-transferring glycine dehydrogenase subunit GcvPA [Acholeplasmataceae bacterium]|nr:aminomethyl-transferring glycine dehydrogenase subunit GcvPA [Acholeplasmataceae bacterium]HQC31035.1 aminomethyl-transferring glycine dehydrogenase subunit GcvPA [Acholeplasmataceae bacterium]